MLSNANSCWYAQLFIGIFFIYPTMTSTLFRALQCVTIGDTQYHEDDYTTDCSSTEYRIMFIISIVLIILVPIGVPVIFFALMKKAKDNLEGGRVNTNIAGGAKLSADDVSDEDDRFAFLTQDCTLAQL